MLFNTENIFMKKIYVMLFVIFTTCSSLITFPHTIINEEDLIEKIALLPADPDIFMPIYSFLRDNAASLKEPEKVRSLIRNLRHLSKNSISIIEGKTFILTVANISLLVGAVGVYSSAFARSYYDNKETNVTLGVSLLVLAFSGSLHLYHRIKNLYFYDLIEKYDQLLDTF